LSKTRHLVQPVCLNDVDMATTNGLEEQLGVAGEGIYHSLLTPCPRVKNSTYKLEMHKLHLTGFDVNSTYFHSRVPVAFSSYLDLE